jgi:hypothetical protein
VVIFKKFLEPMGFVKLVKKLFLMTNRVRAVFMDILGVEPLNLLDSILKEVSMDSALISGKEPIN